MVNNPVFTQPTKSKCYRLRFGEVAVEANPKTLLLPHTTAVTDPRINEVKSIVRDAGYTGKIRAAKDLMVINLDKCGHHSDDRDD